jgi:hypothetical protein
MEPNDDMHDSPQDMPNSQLFVMSSPALNLSIQNIVGKWNNKSK